MPEGLWPSGHQISMYQIRDTENHPLSYPEHPLGVEFCELSVNPSLHWRPIGFWLCWWKWSLLSCQAHDPALKGSRLIPGEILRFWGARMCGLLLATAPVYRDENIQFWKAIISSLFSFYIEEGESTTWASLWLFFLLRLHFPNGDIEASAFVTWVSGNIRILWPCSVYFGTQ